MATYYLESIKDDSENEFVFKLKGINYVDGLPSALSSKAEETSVVHINGNETITGTKTFSNGATVEGTLTVSYIDGTGVIETDGIIRSTGSTIYSQRTSWPLVGARKIDSNGDLLGYAKLEVDNNDKLRLISADADNVDTSIIKYEDGDFKYIGSAKLSTLSVTGNATVTGTITTGGNIVNNGGRFYATKSGTSNCGYEFGNGARYFKFIQEGSQLKFSEEANGGTAAPSSRKSIIYSSGSGDSTAYYFNGNASTATTATTATKATSDANGNNIATTYETKIDAACIGCRVHATGSTLYEWLAQSTTTENVMYLSLGSGFDRTRAHTAIIDCYQMITPMTAQVPSYNVYNADSNVCLVMSNVFRSLNAQGEVLGATKIERHGSIDYATFDTGYSLRSEVRPDGTKVTPSQVARAFHFHTQVQVTIPTTCSQVCWQMVPNAIWAGYQIRMDEYSLSITIL